MSFPDPRLLATLGILSAFPFAVPAYGQSVESALFGKTAAGEPVTRHTLTNAAGLRVSVMTWGATLLGIETPDRAGNLSNITLSLPTFADYEKGHPLLGSVVGRYANRISGGGFTIAGVRHDLDTVNPKTGVHAHGGKEGLASRLWNGTSRKEETAAIVVLTHYSPDGHEGYPGAVSLSVTYRLRNDNALEIDYRATVDKATHLNLTNHAYFNLGGPDSPDVLGHTLTLAAEQFLAIDERKIPTGTMIDVAGTLFDFRTRQPIGSRIGQTPGGEGYDHCYVLTKQGRIGDPTLFARLEDPETGRVMEVLTTQPGVQLYTGNFLKAPLFRKHQGVCLETQHYPDTPNRPEFPTTLVMPGAEYREVTVFRFSVAK